MKSVEIVSKMNSLSVPGDDGRVHRVWLVCCLECQDMRLVCLLLSGPVWWTRCKPCWRSIALIRQKLDFVNIPHSSAFRYTITYLWIWYIYGKNLKNKENFAWNSRYLSVWYICIYKCNILNELFILFNCTVVQGSVHDGLSLVKSWGSCRRNCRSDQILAILLPNTFKWI